MFFSGSSASIDDVPIGTAMTVDPVPLAILSLLWKVVATAGIVIVTGRLAWAAGPVLTSILVALPVNAGPGFFLMSLALDNEFLAKGVIFTLAGAGPVLVYLTVFAQVARLRNFYLALSVGLLVWFLAAWPIVGFDPTVWQALFCAAAGAGFAVICNRRLSGVTSGVSAPASWRYLIIRGGVAGAVIAGIATSAPDIGPAIAGLLLSFPTTMSTTGWMLNGHHGLDFVAATYLSARKAMSLYVAFCLILLVLLEFLSGPAAVLASFGLVAVVGAAFAMVFVRIRARSAE